jgi:DNA-directed RNA polymerase subunit RPC12/RpoP
MIVRCGRCRSELEISGPGEFVCPACGTRNMARGGSRATDPFSLGGAAAGPAAGLGLTVPGGAPVPPSNAPQADIRWGKCPACGFRFAMGEIESVTCPNCRAALSRDATGALIYAPQP